MTIDFMLNGTNISINADPGRRLIDLLRDQLKLKGTKEGCGIGECGACSVLLDDKLVNSCLILAGQIQGRRVMTIEGLNNDDGSLSDLQQSFVDCGAIQCGFCTPGMLLAAEALLKRNSNPTRKEILQAISGNLCRCTGYQQIADAIQLAAERRNLNHASDPNSKC